MTGPTQSPLEIELPPLRARQPVGVLIEQADLDGRRAFTVCTRDGIRSPRRRWFLDHDLAWAHAADQADALGLPLLSLDGAAPE